MNPLSHPFAQFIKEHQAPIRRLFLNLTLGDGMLSDDLAQETFIKAYTSRDRFLHLASTRTWLYRIAYNVFYDWKRSQHPTEGLSPAHTRQGRYDHDPNLKDDIYQAMSLLTDTERLCVTLALVEDRPTKEVARITGLNESTIRSHIHRAREKMTRFLKDNNYD